MGYGQGLTDVAAEEDLFGIKETYIKGLAGFIKNCKTPMTISIQGTWGTGKTSIMKMVESELADDPANYCCIEFNTWEFSQFELDKKLSIVMIQSLIESLSEGQNEGADSIKKILKFAAQIGAGYFSNGAADIDMVLDKGFLTQIKELKDEFQLLVNKKAGIIDPKSKIDKKNKDLTKELLNAEKEGKRVIFFIDDLDRLNPVKAVELLEVLKNFLDCKNCVFVLAIDYDVVWRGVAEKYGNIIGDERAEIQKKGKDFFDKIIQVPFIVPVSTYKIKQYIKKCLEQIEVPVQESELPTYEDLVKTSIGTNPRSLKRIFNSLALLINVIGREELEKNKSYKLLFALLCMQHAYETIYSFVIESIKGDFKISDFKLLLDGEMEEISHKFEDVPFSESHLIQAKPFIKVLYEKAMDLDNNQDVSPEEFDVMKDIFEKSAVTSVSQEQKVSKKNSQQVCSVDELRHDFNSEEEVTNIINRIESLIGMKEPTIMKNTSAYSYLQYKFNGRRFIEICFHYDRNRGYIEIDCTPKTTAPWDREDLKEICSRIGSKPLVTYLDGKGLSFRYYSNKVGAEAIQQDKDLEAIVTACLNDHE